MSLSTDLLNRLKYALGPGGATAAQELVDAVDTIVGLADGKIYIGDVNGNAAEKSVSGDITITREGVVTIGAKKVLETMIALANGKILIGDAGGAAAAQTVSGDITISAAGVAAVGAGKITQAMDVAASRDATIAAVVANANVIGGIPVVFRVNIADASADTDVVSTHKVRILDFWFLNTGIAAHATDDTIQLKNGATAITDAVAKTATVNAIKRAATMDPAQVEIAAGGTIRITAVKSTNAAVTAYILAVRVA